MKQAKLNRVKRGASEYWTSFANGKTKYFGNTKKVSHAKAQTAFRAWLANSQPTADLTIDPPNTIQLSALIGRYIAWIESQVKKNNMAQETLNNKFYQLKPARAHRVRTGLHGAGQPLASVSVADLTTEHMTDWLDARDVSEHTRWCGQAALLGCLNWAVKQKFIANNPIKERPYRVPRRAKIESELPTRAEINQIVAAVPERLADVIELFFETGARPGEITTARVCDVHLKRKVIELANHKNARKTGKIRTIFLSPRAIEIVRDRVAGLDADDRIFPVAPYTITKFIRKACDAAGIRRTKPTMLRHRYASELLQVPGATAWDVASMMGNSPATIEKHYAHFIQAKGQSLTAALAESRSA